MTDHSRLVLTLLLTALPLAAACSGESHPGSARKSRSGPSTDATFSAIVNGTGPGVINGTGQGVINGSGVYRPPGTTIGGAVASSRYAVQVTADVTVLDLATRQPLVDASVQIVHGSSNRTSPHGGTSVHETVYTLHHAAEVCAKTGQHFLTCEDVPFSANQSFPHGRAPTPAEMKSYLDLTKSSYSTLQIVEGILTSEAFLAKAP